jgi:hypothetical protein
VERGKEGKREFNPLVKGVACREGRQPLSL